MHTSNLRGSVEIIGILAVIAGLYFVYDELQLNRTIARAEMSASTNSLLWEIEALERDPKISALLIKSTENPNELTKVERRQINSILLGVLLVYFRERYNYERGIFEEWTSLIDYSAPKYFGQGYGRVYWEVMKTRPGVRQDIVEAVDRALKNDQIINFERNFDSEVLKKLQE